MNHALPHIAITTGEPAGIGPDVCLSICQQFPQARITLIGDADMLAARANQLSIDIQKLKQAPYEPANTPELHVLHIPTATPVKAGELNAANSAYVLETLKTAAQGCINGTFDAMVTAPVHKGIINDAGIAFSGHTEFLAELGNTPHVVMMLVGGGMRVALATTHLALKEIPAAITTNSLINTLNVLHADLKSKFGITQPRIFVAGLNPHAGEGGYLGREEIEVINPVLAQMRASGMDIVGSLPADTMFSAKNLSEADAFLCMYHDQGLPVLKHASFGTGVNITLGLPFIRTSVDHGTALDLAGTGKADAGSLKAALILAIELASRKHA